MSNGSNMSPMGIWINMPSFLQDYRDLVTSTETENILKVACEQLGIMHSNY